VDLLDRLLGHDAWTTAQLLTHAQALSDAQLDIPFDIGPGSVRATLAHMLGNVETWTALMLGQDARQRDTRDDLPALQQRHARGYAAFAALARRLRDGGRLEERWLDTLDAPPQEKTYGGAIAHVILHNMQHRAELLHMLARLGVSDLLEGDLLSWELSGAPTT
jgi:uncharacterized damage-inducible protein DinB